MDYKFQTKPFEHQLERFLKYRDREYHAHLWEQGTGKSKITIDTCAWLYGTGKIDCMVVVAPNGVHRNWIINEIPKHMPERIDYQSAYHAANMKKAERDQMKKTLNHKELRIIAINVEALATAKGRDFLKDILVYNNCLLVIDESTAIKNHKAIRTKALLKMAQHAKYRRILTGTPVTQGPLDLFTQFTFLDKDILPTSSYYAFRARYAVLKEIQIPGQRPFMKVESYCNLDDLQKYIGPFSDRATKDECLDLPDKLYQKHYVTLSKEQERLYKELKKEVSVELHGQAMSTPLALTKLLRLQQIVGGYFQEDVEIDFDDDMNPIFAQKKPPVAIDKENRRVESFIELVAGLQGKAIIWSRFRAEIAEIVKRLKEEYGPNSVVEYHGGVDNATRSENIEAFQNDEECRFFVGHVQAGGKGLTLHAASFVIYFSNNFSLEDRLQSEDRAHRIGQTKNVTYIDIVAQGTLDEKIVTVLREKKNIADYITGDEPMESWL